MSEFLKCPACQHDTFQGSDNSDFVRCENCGFSLNRTEIKATDIAAFLAVKRVTDAVAAYHLAQITAKAGLT